jgi:hypothetical protein
MKRTLALGHLRSNVRFIELEAKQSIDLKVPFALAWVRSNGLHFGRAFILRRPDVDLQHWKLGPAAQDMI